MVRFLILSKKIAGASGSCPCYNL